MSIALQFALIVISVGGLLAAMAIVHMLGTRYGWTAELQRKCVHVTTGLYALTLPLTFGQAWPVIILCAVSIAVLGAMRLPIFAKSAIGSTIHGVERKSYGEILLAVAVGFTFFRSVGNPVLFVLPILILTFSDAAAAMTGVRYGKRIFAVEAGTKSLEGVVMFFLVTFILALIVLLLMTDIPRPSVILLSLVVAAFGAQLEADSWRGFDNLFVPVGLHLFLENNLTAPPLVLVIQAIGFIAVLLALRMWAPRLGLTQHAARGYGVLAFLMLSVTASQNAILPIASMGAFLAVRPQRPCRSPYPDLDFLAAAAGVAALWLFAGEATGHNAINLYNLTFAGVATVFVVLAATTREKTAIAIALVLGALVFVIAPLNPAGQWVSGFAGWIAISLALCAAMAYLRPELFDRHRAPRTFALGLAVPALLLINKSFST